MNKPAARSLRSHLPKQHVIAGTLMLLCPLGALAATVMGQKSYTIEAGNDTAPARIEVNIRDARGNAIGRVYRNAPGSQIPGIGALAGRISRGAENGKLLYEDLNPQRRIGGSSGPTDDARGGKEMWVNDWGRIILDENDPSTLRIHTQARGYQTQNFAGIVRMSSDRSAMDVYWGNTTNKVASLTRADGVVTVNITGEVSHQMILALAGHLSYGYLPRKPARSAKNPEGPANGSRIVELPEGDQKQSAGEPNS
jgi:hypothetical protein